MNKVKDKKTREKYTWHIHNTTNRNMKKNNNNLKWMEKTYTMKVKLLEPQNKTLKMRKARLLLHVTIQISKGRRKKYIENEVYMIPQQAIFSDKREAYVKKENKNTHATPEKRIHKNIYLLPQLDTNETENELMYDRDNHNNNKDNESSTKNNNNDDDESSI